MLLLIRSMKELQFGKLVQVYDGSCATLDAQSYFYEYLRQVFFRTPGAVYCVWQEDDRYVSALRLEPYQDGLLLAGLETALSFRRRGYAGILLNAVLSAYEDRKIYSHIHNRNRVSADIHQRAGFCKVLNHALFLDGSASRGYATYIFQKEHSSAVAQDFSRA